jgi:hypothetical protein
MNDVFEHKEALKKYEDQQKAERDQEERQQKAQEVAIRVDAQRQQAMAASLASVANDNARVPPAANDNYTTRLSQAS